VKVILRFWSGVTILKVTEICVGLVTAGAEPEALAGFDGFTRPSLLYFVSDERCRRKRTPRSGVYLPTNQGVVTWHYAPIIIVLRKCRVKKASSFASAPASGAMLKFED
jgi:hypothetical protein